MKIRVFYQTETRSIAKTVDRPNYFVECPNCGNTELSYVRGEFTGMHDSTLVKSAKQTFRLNMLNTVGDSIVCLPNKVMIEEFIKKFKGTEEQLNQIKGLLLEYKKFELEYVKEFDTKNITKILTKKLKDSYILEKEEGFELVEGYTILKISNEKKDKPYKMIPTYSIIGNKTGCVYQIVA